MPFISSIRGSYSAIGNKSINRAVSSKLNITGGTITTPGDGYRYHTFTSPGTLDLNSYGASVSIDYLLVAGGGGSSGDFSDGGGSGGSGAGGYLSGSAPLGVGSYPVVVGTGGIGGRNAPTAYDPTGTYQAGQNGNNSTFNSLTAVGGGKGAGAGPIGAAGAGGSGGGGNRISSGAGAGEQYPGPAQQGFPGGAGGLPERGGGGGGAGGAGASSGPGVSPQSGGPGLSWPGNGVTYAGGGGGGGFGTSGVGIGTPGSGGGGAGGPGGGGHGGGTANPTSGPSPSNDINQASGKAGATNTGGGSGGMCESRPSSDPAATVFAADPAQVVPGTVCVNHFSGPGGSGIAIVRYAYP